MSLKDKKVWISLAAVFALAFFLRAWNFSDWLHFELDQSRDAKIINLAIEEGAENLPLLGPKAAGSFLRLGPAFYYFKYLSALFFGNTPGGMAFFMAIFGTASVAVFYFFSRRYFDRIISLGLTFLFSLSAFLVMYSRFSWNPNALPLFILLTFYCLLRAVDEKEKRSGWWLSGAAAGVAISIQLHFLAFTLIPLVAVAFLLLKRPAIKLKFWIFSVFVFLFLNSPAILNDFKTGGDNLGQFFQIAEKKSEKSQRGILEKAYRSFSENSAGGFLILSGREGAELPKLNKLSFWRYDINCAQSCRDNLIWGILAAAVSFFGTMLLFWKIFRTKSGVKKDFLMLISIWLIFGFLLFIPIAFSVSPRFFLVIFGIPFVFLGLILQFFFEKMTSKIGLFAFLSVIGLLALGNAVTLGERFSQLAVAHKKPVVPGPDRILKERNRVTLFQQKIIIDHIEKKHRENGFPVYLNSDPHYRRSFLFHLDARKIPRDDLRNAGNSGQVYREGNYFLIQPARSNIEGALEKYRENYREKERVDFGTLILIEMLPKPDFITAERQVFEEKGVKKDAPGVPKRYTWKEVFQGGEGESEDDEDETEDENQI